MKMRGDKFHPNKGERLKIPLLPNNVGKKSANKAGPQKGHNKGEPAIGSENFPHSGIFASIFVKSKRCKIGKK